MVVRIVSSKSIRGLLNYNERKVSDGEADLLMGSLFAGEIGELRFDQKLARFEHLTELNGRVKTNAVHIMLNFDPSEKLAGYKLQQIAVAYMDRIGFAEQPYLVYRHHDAAHPHVHIVTTTIRSDGKRISIHNLGRTLSEDARVGLEKEFNLIKAEGRGLALGSGPHPIAPEVAAYGKIPTKRAISNVVVPVSQNYLFSSLTEYKAILEVFRVTADRCEPGSAIYERQGLVYSIIDEQGQRTGIPFKASALPHRPTMRYLEEKFARNQEKRERLKVPVRNKIQGALDSQKPASIRELIWLLEAQKISAVFHQNEKGFIYGITFIDHGYQAAFKGSDLGKGLTAQAILNRLGKGEARGLDKRKPREVNRSSSRDTTPWAHRESLNSGKLPSLQTAPSVSPLGYLPVIPRPKKKRKKGPKLS